MENCETCSETTCECDFSTGDLILITEGAYDDHKAEGVVKALKSFSIHDLVAELFPDHPQDIRQESLAYRNVIKHLLTHGYVERVIVKQLHHDYLERHPSVYELELDVENL